MGALQIKTRHLTIVMLTIIIYVLVFGIVSYLAYSNDLEKISVVFLSPYSKKIFTDIFSGQNKNKNLESIKENGEINDYALLDITYDYSNIRGIFFKGSVDSPNMLQGRYFNQNDFLVNNKIAVIGKNLLNNSILINGKRYIKILDNNYEVIGVMGYTNKTILDNYVFINFDSYQTTNISPFYIDSIKRSRVDNVITQLQHIGNVNIIIDKLNGINRLFKYDKINNNIIILLLVIICIILSIKLYFFLISIKPELYVYKMLGFNKKNTSFLIIRSSILNELFGFSISLLMYMIFYYCSGNLKNYVVFFPPSIFVFISVIFLISITLQCPILWRKIVLKEPHKNKYLKIINEDYYNE